MSERVAIVGAREHPCLDIVADCVALLPGDVVVVSGGARGVDSYAVEMARARGLLTEVFRPQSPEAQVRTESEWLPRCALLGLSDRDQLLYRNTLIALRCHRMTIFPDGSKGGCWDAAREAVRLRRPVEVWKWDPRTVPRYHVKPFRGHQ